MDPLDCVPSTLSPEDREVSNIQLCRRRRTELVERVSCPTAHKVERATALTPSHTLQATEAQASRALFRNVVAPETSSRVKYLVGRLSVHNQEVKMAETLATALASIQIATEIKQRHKSRWKTALSSIRSSSRRVTVSSDGPIEG
jgi:hypothetical protein